MEMKYNSNAGLVGVTDMPTSEKNKTLVVDADNTIYERKEHNNKYVRMYYNGDKSLVALYERDGETAGKETGKYRFSTVNDSGLDNLSRLQPSAILVTKPGMTLENVVDSFLGANREMLLLPLQLANGGIASNEELPVGFQVQVPNGFFESRFNASVQREADISRIVGDMGPTMLTPEFDEPSFGIKEVLPMAIAAAVAAVVMIYAPQFAPAALSILSKTAAGAAALTAGEIARQASSIALNTQQGIDMEKLGKQAIIGAITGGAAGASQVASQTMLGTTLDKATQGQQIMASMQTAAAVNLSQQLADKSASFSWNQLVCDMLLSAVGTVEARKIPQFDSMLKQYAAEVATVLVNAGLSAAMAKALQNKEISPQAFTIGLASQIAASAPKAWDTVSGNRERIAAQSQKAENIKTPVQQRETKMEAKRQTEQQKAKTNAPVKSVASAKKARSENKGSATKKPVLNGYRNSNRASNNASVSKQEFPHKLAESIDKYTHFDVSKSAVAQANLAVCGIGALEGAGITLQEMGSSLMQTWEILKSPVGLALMGAIILKNGSDGTTLKYLANEITEDLDTLVNGSTVDRCRLTGEYATSGVMAWGAGKLLKVIAPVAKMGVRFGGEEAIVVARKQSSIPAPHSLDNPAARQWYHDELKQIPDRINKKLSKKAQALQAYSMRNEIKIQARILMKDRKAAEKLMLEEPPKTLKDMARRAYEDNKVGEDFWDYLKDGSQRTNATVDKKFGMSNKFAPKRNK
jgi:hypothetical protein